MDGQTPTPPNIAQTQQSPSGGFASSPIPPNETPKEKRGILFEILFVVIVLILVFGLLNYLNILKLSEIFPNQLGFLPRKDAPTGTSQQSKQYNNVTVSPSDQAKQTLINFLPTILASSLLPASSEVTLIGEKENNTFSSPLNQGSGKVTITVSSDGKQISELLLFLPYQTTDPASVQLAEQITPQFFLIEPKGTWGCKQLPSKATYCENFWEEENGIRKGVGIQEPNPIKNQKQLFLFYCENSKESSSYSWKSCTNEFSQTGVTP